MEGDPPCGLRDALRVVRRRRLATDSIVPPFPSNPLSSSSRRPRPPRTLPRRTRDSTLRSGHSSARAWVIMKHDQYFKEMCLKFESEISSHLQLRCNCYIFLTEQMSVQP